MNETRENIKNKMRGKRNTTHRYRHMRKQYREKKKYN